MNRESVDSYLAEGCGRCDRYRTPDCKVHRWSAALVALRKLALASGLDEAMKWGSPCYSIDGRNVAMIAAFNDSCALSLFSGAALIDEDGVLEQPGPNSRHARYVRFHSADDVERLRPVLAKLLAQAMTLDRATAAERIGPAEPEPMPDELADVLAATPAVREAFDALTPGRQRSHILHVSGASQPDARKRRAEKCAAKILEGKGFNER